MAERDARTLRYYVRNDIVPFEEDAIHEFKGHTNLSVEELPPWVHIEGTDKKTRATVSKVINGFLNTGEGGTVYLGIIDDGTVKGVTLTLYQQDHFEASLEDLMGRYNPPVEDHRYSVTYVPIVERDMSEEEILKIVTCDHKVSCDPVKRKARHLLRTYRYCWCHKEAQSRFNMGYIAPSYVIEIKIKRWDPDDTRSKWAVGDMRCHPIHQDETQRSFFRRQSSVIEYNSQELYTFSQKMVDDKYVPEIERLKKERDRLRRLIAEKRNADQGSK